MVITMVKKTPLVVDTDEGDTVVVHRGKASIRITTDKAGRLIAEPFECKKVDALALGEKDPKLIVGP